MKFIAVCMLFMLCADLPAQRILMHQTTKDFAGTKKGPNQRYFSYPSVQFGFPFAEYFKGMNSSTGIQFAIGVNNKLKLNRFFSFIGTVGYQHQRANFIPIDFRNNYFKEQTGLYDISRASVRLNELECIGNLRINIGKRGNHMGFYVDAGINCYVIFSERLKMRGYALGAGGVSLKQKSLGLQNLYGYGLITRVGWHNKAVFMRISQTDNWVRPLPVYTIGIEFGLF